ncbi:unnamed protein product [Ceutorhynchus assimilis]|uniref:SWIM-type domain-containing protein n=1 Tax=Ceutorhynchus assimilis TaxID=467358 RepID=A0A9N9MSJ1_9CUCU|nr:unnamed protein product [Ceutorhynchus assimilis]
MERAKDYFKSKQLPQTKFERDYKYFCDGYISDIFTAYNISIDETMVSAKCYRSQRKNSPPHKLRLLLTNLMIKEASCSCLIGLTQACGHLVGLCFTLEHFILRKYQEVPDELTCTEILQKWDKPRGKSVAFECVMDVSIRKPSETPKKRAPLYCKLQKMADLNNSIINDGVIEKNAAELKEINP